MCVARWSSECFNSHCLELEEVEEVEEVEEPCSRTMLWSTGLIIIVNSRGQYRLIAQCAVILQKKAKPDS